MLSNHSKFNVNNLLSDEFGIVDELDLQRFTKNYLASGKLKLIVNEYFEESLVLLKREFGWSFSDILFLQTYLEI